MPEGRAFLTNKTIAMFAHAYAHYKDSIDWFLKADDDTYVIMENLRHLVAGLDTNTAHYIGAQIPALRGNYNSGGAG